MKITKNDDAASKEFWRVTESAWEKVCGWPDWKRNLKVTKYSNGLKCVAHKKANTSSSSHKHTSPTE